MSMQPVSVVAFVCSVCLTLGSACSKRYGDRRADEPQTAPSESAPPAEREDRAADDPGGTSTQETGGKESDASTPSSSTDEKWSFHHPPCRSRTAEEEAAEAGADERTEEYEAFVSDVRQIGEKRDSEFGRTRWSIDETDAETCRAWVDGEPTPSSDANGGRGDCTVEFQLGMRAAVVHRRTECGGDSCTVHRYVWPETSAQPTRIDAADSSSSIEVLPSLDTVVFDRGFAGISGDSPVNVERNELKGGMPRILLRSRLGNEEACVLATCFSPKLAPDGETALCRTRRYGVRAASPHAAFGESREVEHVDDVPGRPHVRVQWGAFASPAEFVDEETFEYEIVTDVSRDDGSRETEKVTRTSTLSK